MKITVTVLRVLSCITFVAPSIITPQTSHYIPRGRYDVRVGVVRFVNYVNGEALAASDNSEGASIITRPIADHDNNQRWHIVYIGNEKLPIVNNGTGKVLTAIQNIDRSGPNDVEAKQISFDDYDAKFQIEFFRFYHSDSAAFIYNRAMAQGQGALDISTSETNVTHSSCPNQLDSPITKVILTSRDLPEESYSQAWFLEYLDGTA